MVQRMVAVQHKCWFSLNQHSPTMAGHWPGSTGSLFKQARDPTAPSSHMNGEHKNGPDEETIVLDFPQNDQFGLIGADTEKGRFTLTRFRNEILAIDRQRHMTIGPISPPSSYDVRWGFRWLNGDWVSWDGYR